MVKEIGVKVKAPRRSCDDPKCPFHGDVKVRGATILGEVVADKMDKGVVVSRDYLHYLPKYSRYERRRSRIHAHNPPCMSANVGDVVRLMECRRLSKTKSFVVIEKVGKA